MTTACITWKGNTNSKHKWTSPTTGLSSPRGGQLPRPQCYLSQTLVEVLSAVLACIKHPRRHGVSMSVSPSRASSTEARRKQEPQLPVELSLSPPQILPSGGYVRVLRILTHLKQSLVLAFSLCIVLSKTRRSDAGSSSWRNQPRHWSLKEKHSCQVILRYLEFFQHLSLHLPPSPKRFC